MWKKISDLVTLCISQKFLFMELCMISVLSYLCLQLQLPSYLKSIFLFSISDETLLWHLLQFLQMKNHLKI